MLLTDSAVAYHRQLCSFKPSCNVVSCCFLRRAQCCSSFHLPAGYNPDLSYCISLPHYESGCLETQVQLVGQSSHISCELLMLF